MTIIRLSSAAVGISICVLASLVAAGCGGETAHEDDHLEHHVPEHKPADLAAAAEVLPRRWQALESKWRQSEPTAVAAELSELSDIVRWLPELAGDSDMPEEPWNRVSAISMHLLARLLSVSESRGGPAISAFPQHAEVEPLLTELSQLASAVADKPSAAQEHRHD